MFNVDFKCGHSHSCVVEETAFEIVVFLNVLLGSNDYYGF